MMLRNVLIDAGIKYCSSLPNHYCSTNSQYHRHKGESCRYMHVQYVVVGMMRLPNIGAVAAYNIPLHNIGAVAV